MKQIITIQHTQSIHHTNGMVGSWTDWDLSEPGIVQAEKIGQNLAKQLAGQEYVLYTSDLLRAKHTAEIVAEHLGIAPICIQRSPTAAGAVLNGRSAELRRPVRTSSILS